MRFSISVKGVRATVCLAGLLLMPGIASADEVVLAAEPADEAIEVSPVPADETVADPVVTVDAACSDATPTVPNPVPETITDVAPASESEVSSGEGAVAAPEVGGAPVGEDAAGEGASTSEAGIENGSGGGLF